MTGVLRLIIVKLSYRIIILFIILTLIFLIPRLAPGLPIDYLVEDPRVPPEIRSELMAKFGLDKPIFPDQYLDFLERTILHLDFGYSFMYQESVFKVIAERITWSILLVGSALAISFILGTCLGIFAAWRRGKITDYSVVFSVLFVRSMPRFLDRHDTPAILILLLQHISDWRCYSAGSQIR